MSQNGSGLDQVMVGYLLDPRVFARYTGAQAELVARFMREASSLSEDGEDHLQELLGLGALHPSSLIRATAVELARTRAQTSEAAQDLLVWAIHDPDDAVATAAIRACGELQIERALPELFTAAGRTPSSLRGVIGSLTDLRQYAATAALRTLTPAHSDPLQDSERLQDELLQEERVPPPEVDTTGMVHVEAGEFFSGLASRADSVGWFPVDEIVPGQRCFVPDFYIDARPVTNSEYDVFVEEVDAVGHLWCHPDEPKDMDHHRSTRFDQRLGPDDPATGCSWYDAYAYASWKGKKLASDLQWEKAARGMNGQLYPWGNSFDPAMCNWAGVSCGAKMTSADDWRRAVEAIRGDWPARLTRPSTEFPSNVSPYEVEDMTGNVWEWTRSRFLDRRDMDPRFRGLDFQEILGDWSAFVCVKGGSWASAGDMLLPAYRGKRHLYTRGPEVGFRCVYEPPVAASPVY